MAYLDKMGAPQWIMQFPWWATKIKINGLPSIHDRHNSSLPVGDLHESRLGHIKMGTWGVAPSPSIGVLLPIGWAKVSSSDCGEWGPFVACSRVHTSYLITSSTSISVLKQCWAQSFRIRPVSTAIQVSIPTGPSWQSKWRRNQNED